MAEARSTSLDYRGRGARLVMISDRSAEQEVQQRRDQALLRLEEAQAIARLGSWQLWILPAAWATTPTKCTECSAGACRSSRASIAWRSCWYPPT